MNVIMTPEQEGQGDCPVELMKENQVGFSLRNAASICEPDQAHSKDQVEEHRVEVHARNCPPAHLQNLATCFYLHVFVHVRRN